MKRLLAGGMVMVAGIMSVPAGSPGRQQPTQPAPDYRDDPRYRSLARFFHQMDCPAEEYTADFIKAADANALDWRLLPSLSFLETTGGKMARNHNLFGWDSGRAHFPSPAAAIHEVGYQLRHSSPYKDKELDELLAQYNPATDEYAQKVKSVMRRIAPAE